MVEAAQKALHFTAGKSRKDLTTDEQLALAVVRLIEIIGEAAAKVTPQLQEKYPSIPWKEIVGTRNRLIHGYEEVDLDIVWQIVTTDLRPLVPNLQEVINKEGGAGQQRLL